MKNNTAKKAIISYYILSIFLTLPLLIPIYLINDPLRVIGYFVCCLIYMRIVINFAVQATIMPSLWKELDAEKYAAIINANPFRVNHSYRLNLYFAVGDYQSAYNIISSVLLQHKNVQLRIHGYLLLCRICFERGDYEGIKESLAEIDKYRKNNPKLKFLKQNKESYEFYLAFSDADYASSSALLEKSIEKYSKNKNRTYVALMRQYQLAVTKRMNGDIEGASSLFEKIKEKSPKLVFSSLAQKQLEILSGALEEKTPEQLEVTENCVVTPPRKAKVFRFIIIILLCIGGIRMFAGKILTQLDSPEQENKDSDYIAELESSIQDEYEEYQILGYFDIYVGYPENSLRVDSLFLVESNKKLDLHTPYRLNGKYMNVLNAKDIQIDKLYEYEIYFSPYNIEFVLTEKKRNIPANTLYYYEIDGYYFCVINVSHI